MKHHYLTPAALAIAILLGACASAPTSTSLLESARKSTRPRSVDLYEVFCAVLYLLRTGCQWRALPSDFPKWRTVHAYFAIWSEPREGGSLLEQALKKSGWRGPRETGAQRLKQVLDRGRAEREEHGHGGQQGL